MLYSPQNQLKLVSPSITFVEINLLWTFTNQNGDTFTNKALFKNEVGTEDRNSIYNIVASTFIKQIKLNEHEKKVVVMKLTPHHIGNLDIQAVVGKLVKRYTYFFLLLYQLSRMKLNEN